MQSTSSKNRTKMTIFLNFTECLIAFAVSAVVEIYESKTVQVIGCLVILAVIADRIKTTRRYKELLKNGIYVACELIYLLLGVFLVFNIFCLKLLRTNALISLIVCILFAFTILVYRSLCRETSYSKWILK